MKKEFHKWRTQLEQITAKSSTAAITHDLGETRL